MKAALFGLNAAELFGIDPTATRCGLAADPLTENIQETAQLHQEGALPSVWKPNGPVSRRQILDWLASTTTSWVPS
jgi:hypothetical protein